MNILIFGLIVVLLLVIVNWLDGSSDKYDKEQEVYYKHKNNKK